MKLLLRNFLSIVRRFKMAMTLNVFGFAVAFAAFMIILMQVRYEYTFDRCHPTADRVFRVDMAGVNTTFGSIHSRGLVEEVIASSPHIEAGTLLCPYIGEIYFTVEREGMRQGYKETLYSCSPAFPQVFGLTLIEGDAHCLAQPDKVMIPQSMARRMFGNGSAVGKSLHAEEPIWTKDENQLNYTVGAVYRDLPGNTQLRNVIYTAIDPEYMRMNFTASNYICYLLLDDASNAKEVADNFNRSFDFVGKRWNSDAGVTLIPLTDIYFQSGSVDARIFKAGDRETTYLLLGIALLIILVGAINFTNFSTSLTPLRIRCINTQKVLGSSETSLRLALLAEACIISVVAWILGLFIIALLADTQWLSFVESDLDMASNWMILAFTGLLALLIGVLSGLYPAWYVTSFPPALVLKRSFGLSPSGRKLRAALMGIQFVFSLILIIFSLFIRLQNGYMRHYQLGFDKDQVAIVELSSTLYMKHHEIYANRLKEYPGIEDVAFAMEKVGSQDGYNTNTAEYKGEKVQFFLIGCSPNFLDLMGIKMEAGRNFTKADEKGQDTYYIFNRKAREQYQMELGDAFGRWLPGRLIGFVGDVKLTSLRQQEGNIAFAVAKAHMPMPISYIRLKAGIDVHAAVDHIRKTLNDLDSSYPFQIEFYDTVFDQLYHREELFNSMIWVLSLLAVILSLVGVFGLVVFDSEYRRKEIGIRKVHGATVDDILLMFNRAYLRVVVICFVVAAPLAWYGVSRWLENFAYKTPMYVWVYAVALLLVAVITIATVTFQNWRAANANPVDSIKSE